MATGAVLPAWNSDLLVLHGRHQNAIDDNELAGGLQLPDTCGTLSEGPERSNALLRVGATFHADNEYLDGNGPMDVNAAGAFVSATPGSWADGQTESAQTAMSRNECYGFIIKFLPVMRPTVS